ncbi:MAG: Outer rane autotransporter barrel [Myxococcaceae bacterium]|nr:Outer rane autotransporter barrel [Myxococcaceae bacterium]
MKTTRKTTRVGFAGLPLALILALGSVAAEDRAEPPAAAPRPAAVELQVAADELDVGTPAQSGELAQIERELAAVMDELVSARARAGVLARSLFHTELRVEVGRRARAQNLLHVVLRLDGVPVHESEGAALSSGHAQLFSGYVTPGRHELAIELTEAGKDDASYGYTRSERYRVEVKKDRRTRVQLLLRDDSDMAEEAAEGDEGEYQIDTTVRVTSERVGD